MDNEDIYLDDDQLRDLTAPGNGCLFTATNVNNKNQRKTCPCRKDGEPGEMDKTLLVSNTFYEDGIWVCDVCH
mgnify:CR=1 FL=1